MNRLKTLRVRFALWIAGFLLSALALFGLFVYSNMARVLIDTVDETLRVAAIQLTAEAEVRQGELVFVEFSIEDAEYTALREHDFSMRILNLAGQLVAEHGPYADLAVPAVDSASLPRTGEYTTMTDPDSQALVRVYTAPLLDEAQLVGITQVFVNLKDERRTLNLLLITLLIGGPVIVIVAGSGGYFLAARALAPIDKITRTARHISTRDLSARLNLPETDDEVGRLAATFDSMLARLEDGFRRERQFTADASHELRTPLSAMQTIISGTLAQQRNWTEYRQALLDLNQETEQMKTLTEELLNLARDDSIRQPLKLEQVDLSFLLKDVIDSLRPLAEDKGLTLVDNVPNESLLLRGDSDGLIRLFVNLITNAIKYSEQGLVTITAKSENTAWLTVTVSDMGIGIASEHLPYIFDRFYRADASRSEEGTGLGLAIALKVARTHGGNITVESNPGRGTTFTVQLATDEKA